MNKEKLEWLLDIATPTGISYSGDKTITIEFANKVINHINKQKEVLDNIKDIIKDRAYWCDETEDGNIVSGKLLHDDDITEIEELLEEIE